MAQFDDLPFVKLAVAAFPWNCRPLTQEAARILAPAVDDTYRSSFVSAVVQGRTVQIPKRIHFTGVIEMASCPSRLHLVIECLRTRSTDGYIRQLSLQMVLSADEPWVLPFIVMLAGEYVVEIAGEIFEALPNLAVADWVSFVRENRTLMSLLRSKAFSYWNCYYRDSFPDRWSYPGLAFLRELERWAA